MDVDFSAVARRFNTALGSKNVQVCGINVS